MGILGGRRKARAGVPGGDDDELGAWGRELARILAPPPDGSPSAVRSGPPSKVGRHEAQRLADEVVGHVLTGVPAAVPAGVTGPAAHAVGLSSGFGTDAGDLFRRLTDVPPAVGLRFARVLEAAFAGWTGSFCLTLPGGVHWPEVLLVHAVNTSRHEEPGARSGLTMGALEALQAEAGWDPATLLVAVLRAEPPRWHESTANDEFCRLPDAPEAIARHADTLRREFPAPLPPRGWTLTLIERADDDTLPRFAQPLARAAVAGGREQRAQAGALVERCGAAAVAPLRGVVADGRPDERAAALRLLRSVAGRTGDTGLTSWVGETAAADRAASVRRLASEWAAAEAAPAAARPYEYEVPVIDWRVPVDAEAEKSVRVLWESLARWAERRHAARGGRHVTPAPADAVLRYLASDAAEPAADVAGARFDVLHTGHELTSYVAPDAFPPAGLVKLVAALGGVRLERYDATIVQILDHLRRGRHQVTLLEASELLRPFGVRPQAVLDRYCMDYIPLARGWPDADVWPFFAHHLDLLEDVVARRTTRDWGFDATGPFRALRTLPWLQPSTVDLLFAIALGPSKTDRPQAQALLDELPGTAERILPALADGKAEVRIVAAQWLARLRHEPAVPVLEKAFRTERQDVVRAAILDALEALGRPVERYLDRDGLAADAERAVRKGLPAALAWFPWDRLPAVRWADDGTPVPDAVLRMFLVQAVKQRTSVPNALLRKHCARFEPRDREAFGQFVLQSWLAEDVRPISADEARERALSSAQMWHQAIQQYPQHYASSPYAGKSLAEIEAMVLPSMLHTPAGSAVASKGVLAVAAACASERAAPAAEAYLRRWYGTRMAQGKALVAMLAWVDHRSATQLMLAVGSRFRTKGIQEEARRQAAELAERNGWTVDELADRTTPTAGFDASGEQLLDYGPRAFTAVLGPGLAIELRDPAGAPVKALPAPRQTDDAELAAAAKKALSATRKELKSVVTLQTQRLYEAMCTGRGWTYQDWHDYLLAHPILRQLVQRLVWVAEPPAGDGDGEGRGDGAPAAPVLFRPLDDGTLTDADDEEVRLPPDAVVRVAHGSTAGAGAAAQWEAHLADYDVAPLFPQFGRGSRAVPEPRPGDMRITDVEGHLIETFALRGRATRLGWTRGPAEDSAVFTMYTKDFASLGLRARIHFTGSYVPEENLAAALTGLDFAELGDGGTRWQEVLRPLRDVPPVLLAECYQDLWLIADEGTGYDPEWQKKAAM